MSIKEHLINTHRDSVKGSCWGRLNVLQTLYVLHALDALWLGVLCWQNHIFETRMMGSGLRNHIYLHLVCTIMVIIGFIPGTFWLYLSLPFHAVKILHPGVVSGVLAGKMLLWMHYIKGNADRKLLRILLNILLRSGLFTVLLTIHFKTLLSAAILWYHLVLERIRSAGGKGMELKTALELEMEAAMFNKPREDGTPMVVLTDG